MKRIICDICGSEYGEVELECPVCGYARHGGEKFVEVDDVEQSVAVEPAVPAGRVKGGLFAPKNVKKRHKARLAAENRNKEKNPDGRLWIIIVVLLAAIVVLTVYIGQRFFWGRDIFKGDWFDKIVSEDTTPFSGIILQDDEVHLYEVGQTYQIVVQLLPEGTKDVPRFSVSDPSVATVSEDGLLTAVAPGQTVVKIGVGTSERECKVVCVFADPTPDGITGEDRLTLDRDEYACSNRNESFSLNIYLDGEFVSPFDAAWTSSDPDVAKVEMGQVTAVGKGTATITAEYEGMTASCEVSCQFGDASWKLSHTDVSLKREESFRLKVTNEFGETAEVTWTADKDGVVSIKGNKITGVNKGKVTLTATVDGVTLECIVRVK